MNRKVRILFTIPNFKTAGSQYVLLSLIKRLDVTRFVIFVGVDNHFDEAYKVVNSDQLIKLPKPNNKKVFLKAYVKALSVYKIQVVHSWDYKSNILEPLACRLAGVKYLYTKKNNSWSRSWFIKSLLSHIIVYDQPDMASTFFDHKLFKGKIHFIPHGVDLAVFRPLKKIKHSYFNICCVSNINENKNQLFLIEALLDLPDYFHLQLYGKGELNYINKLKKFILAKGLEDRVYFKGYIENIQLPEIFREQDVFVLPSFQEGLPVSILEAMACGLPVLCSDSGGGTRFILGEMLKNNLISLRGSYDYINKLKQLEGDLVYKEELKLNGIEIVEKRFSIQKEVALYDKLYNSFNL